MCVYVGYGAGYVISRKSPRSVTFDRVLRSIYETDRKKTLGKID